MCLLKLDYLVLVYPRRVTTVARVCCEWRNCPRLKCQCAFHIGGANPACNSHRDTRSFQINTRVFAWISAEGILLFETRRVDCLFFLHGRDNGYGLVSCSKVRQNYLADQLASNKRLHSKPIEVIKWWMWSTIWTRGASKICLGLSLVQLLNCTSDRPGNWSVSFH